MHINSKITRFRMGIVLMNIISIFHIRFLVWDVTITMHIETRQLVIIIIAFILYISLKVISLFSEHEVVSTKIRYSMMFLNLM